MLKFGKIYREAVAEALSARTITNRRSFISALCNKDKGSVNTLCLNLLNDRIIFNIDDETQIGDVEVLSISDSEFESICRKITVIKNKEVLDLRYQTFAQIERAIANLRLNGFNTYVAVSQDMCPLFSGRLIFDQVKVDERYNHITTL